MCVMYDNEPASHAFVSGFKAEGGVLIEARCSGAFDAGFYGKVRQAVKTHGLLYTKGAENRREVQDRHHSRSHWRDWRGGAGSADFKRKAWQSLLAVLPGRNFFQSEAIRDELFAPGVPGKNPGDRRKRRLRCVSGRLVTAA